METKEKLETFKNLTNDFLTSNSNLKYEWGEQDNGNIWCVSISKAEEQGFDVWFGFDGCDIYFSAGEAHHSEFDIRTKEPLERQIKQFLGFIRDLLSNKMRIVEKYAGKTAYKVSVQAWDGQNWNTEDVYGLLLFNYFAKRSEKIYQNNILHGHDIKTT